MPLSTDQSQVIPVAHRLARLGCLHGASTVLFNAAQQRQAADVRDAPKGDVIKPQKQFHAANNHRRASKPDATIA